jgi:hypothetical protein
MNGMVVTDINRRLGTAYDPKSVKFVISRQALVNDMDAVNQKAIEAQTKKTLIEAAISASTKLDDESVVQLICEQFDLDLAEVKERLDADKEIEPPKDWQKDADPEELPTQSRLEK